MPEAITRPAVETTPLPLLKPAPSNPREIKDERFQNLVQSIETAPEFLWRRPVLAMADGTVYAGNMRFRAAEHLGLESIPAIREDIPEQLAKERALRDNAQWGEWAEDDLAAMLEALRSDGTAMDLLGFDERELQKLLNSLDHQGGLTDPDEVPELPEESTSMASAPPPGPSFVFRRDLDGLATLLPPSAARLRAWPSTPMLPAVVCRSSGRRGLSHQHPSMP